MFLQLTSAIEDLEISKISEERKQILKPLIDYIQQKVNEKAEINLNLICTHNSRRSHLSQVWSQTMASFYNIKNVHSYSGGTEATALFPMVAKTLTKNGFQIKNLLQVFNRHPALGAKLVFYLS